MPSNPRASTNGRDTEIAECTFDRGEASLVSQHACQAASIPVAVAITSDNDASCHRPAGPVGQISRGRTGPRLPCRMRTCTALFQGTCEQAHHAQEISFALALRTNFQKRTHVSIRCTRLPRLPWRPHYRLKVGGKRPPEASFHWCSQERAPNDIS